MSTQAARAAHVERRRSTRVPIRMAIIHCEDAERFQEHTCASSLNAYGALLTLPVTVTMGQRLVIKNPETWAERGGRVRRLGPCYEGRTEGRNYVVTESRELNRNHEEQ
jgi:hypothetical protein